MPTKEFHLVKQGSAAKIYVDPKGKIMMDYAGWHSLLQQMLNR